MCTYKNGKNREENLEKVLKDNKICRETKQIHWQIGKEGTKQEKLDRKYKEVQKEIVLKELKEAEK